tara:strand:- start:667 stop:813 length:147 start_codon:yes stop_codon:yes gene_type:complete
MAQVSKITWQIGSLKRYQIYRFLAKKMYVKKRMLFCEKFRADILQPLA